MPNYADLKKIIEEIIGGDFLVISLFAKFLKCSFLNNSVAFDHC